MANFRALTIQLGTTKQQQDSDTLLVGAGISNVSGALSVDPGSAAALSIGVTNANAIAIGKSGITTTVTGGLTQLTGALSLTGNAASSIATSSGALTLTSAAAATWSTAAGALTVNGAAGLNLQTAAATRLAVTNSALTIQAGVTLATTGSGNINLPNNGSARFQIEGTAVGSTVTAPNLDTLTNGGNADALHVHAGGAATVVSLAATSGEAIDAGNVVAIDDSSSVPRIFKADANGAGELPNVIGISNSTVGAAGNAVTVYLAGERSIPDAVFSGGVPAVTDVGKKVFLSETAGFLTLTAPSTLGSTVQKVGIVSQGGSGAVKVLIQIGDGVVL